MEQIYQDPKGNNPKKTPQNIETPKIDPNKIIIVKPIIGKHSANTNDIQGRLKKTESN